MNSPATRLLIFPLCAALVAGTALHALSLPAHADTTTTTIINLPDQAIPKTWQEKEAELRRHCTDPAAVPPGVEPPDPEACQKFVEEKARQERIERERSITTGHPLEPVKPEPPVQPVQ